LKKIQIIWYGVAKVPVSDTGLAWPGGISRVNIPPLLSARKHFIGFFRRENSKTYFLISYV
jgi:hypothetical protein